MKPKTPKEKTWVHLAASAKPHFDKFSKEVYFGLPKVRNGWTKVGSIEGFEPVIAVMLQIVARDMNIPIGYSYQPGKNVILADTKSPAEIRRIKKFLKDLIPKVRMVPDPE